MTASFKQQVAHNTAIQIIGKISGTALSLIVAGMMFRYLGDTRFGSYAAALSLVQIFGTLMDLGLYVLLIKKLAAPNEPEETIHTLFTLRIVSGALFLLCAPLTGLLLGLFSSVYTSEIILGTLIATVFAFGISMNQLFSAVFQKFFVSRWIAIGEIISKVSLLVGVLIVVALDAGLLGMLAALSLSTLASTILLFAASREYITLRWHWNTSIVLSLLREAWPVAVSVALVLLYFRGDVIILSLFEHDPQPIGIYSAPYKILEVLITFPAMFTGLMLNPITHHWRTQQFESARTLIRQSTTAIALLAFPIVAGLLAIPEPIMHLIAGRAFTESAHILQILSLACGGIFFGTLFGYVVVALDKQRAMMFGYAIVAVTALLFYFIAIPQFSLYGAAWVTVYSEMLVALIAYIIIQRTLRFAIHWAALLKILCAAVLMGISVHWLAPFTITLMTSFTQSVMLQDGLTVAVLTLFGACIYAALLIVTRTTSFSELKSLIKRT